MAIIKCPNCKKDISDKAISCPSCGVILQNKTSTVNTCKECGSELRNDYSYCRNCGCPINSNNEQVQTNQIEVINIKHKKTAKNKKPIIICIILVIAILSTYAISQKVKVSNYETTLNSVSTLMIEGASTAEDAGNLIHDVWYNTIFEKRNAETDKFTMTSNKKSFNDDFNDSLANLFSDYTFCNKLETIRENRASVISMMKELTNPPKEYQEAYSILKDYYEAYSELTDLVLNPTGTLTTFTNDFNEAEQKVLDAFEAIAIYI
ncbi:MAG: zinc ribbon domain-containing protein [Eubacterium sp.]|nr:zinc ribbon domain-containing protein [Eubacterium sp.]